MNHPFPITSRKLLEAIGSRSGATRWTEFFHKYTPGLRDYAKRIATSILPDYRFHGAREFIQAVRHRNLRRTLLRTLFAFLALGLIAMLVVIPSVIRQREQAKAEEAERQRIEKNVRRAQDSLMREIQLFTDEK